MRWPVPLMGVLVALGACALVSVPPGTRGIPLHGSGGLLVLAAVDRVAIVDPHAERVVFDGVGLSAAADASRLVTWSATGQRTSVQLRDVGTRSVIASVQAAGDLAVRVVSADGSAAALMAPPPQGANPWKPRPARTTTITVADLGPDPGTRTFELPGNFDPEAFSSDGRSLFMLRYVPPMRPAAYRVVRLDLARGRVDPVSVPGVNPNDKAVVETMSGTRLSQVASPGGDRLYTLYTTQPRASDRGAPHDDGERPVAFVHTLDVDEGWAHCIALPEELWGGDPGHQAMVPSADGELLYVVDAGRDLVTVVDADRLETLRTERVDLPEPGGTQVRAAISPDHPSLVVATGRRVVVLDAGTLERRTSWTVPGAVTGVGFSTDGRNLYLSTADAIEAVTWPTGRFMETLLSPAMGSVDTVDTVP